MSRLRERVIAISFGDSLDDCTRCEEDDYDQYNQGGLPIQKHQYRIHAVRLFLEKAITRFIPSLPA
jgi:hypothetical protein